MCAVLDAPLRSLHESKNLTTEDTEHLVPLRSPCPLWLRFSFRSRGSLERRVPVTVVQPAIAPLALLVFRDALEQVQPAKIRPQSRGHVDLCVSELPQQEVAQPHLTGRAADKIWILQMA